MVVVAGRDRFENTFQLVGSDKAGDSFDLTFFPLQDGEYYG